MREAASICPRPLQVDLLSLKVVSESRVTWATSMSILVFLGLSVLDLGPMYATDKRQMSNARHHLMPPTLGKVKVKCAILLLNWSVGGVLISLPEAMSP